VTGALEGAVKWTGASLPTPTLVQNSTDPQVCGSTFTVPDVIVSPATSGIENVIVVLTDVPADKAPAPVPGRLVLDNRKCAFSPHVSVLAVGSTIDATNSDSALHTTHLYGPIEANIALPLKGQHVLNIVDKPGLVIVKCDVHGWMQAFIRVDAHPFHAVSNDSGSFTIPDVPPGEYGVEAWHEKLGTERTRVEVRSGETVRVSFQYSSVQK
jgi:plastocyanin